MARAGTDGPLSLRDHVVIVPTRQAGRRLRRSLARHLADQNTALIAPLVHTPAGFVKTLDRTGPPPAPESLTLRAWATVLAGIHPAEHRALFPVHPVDRDVSWCIDQARMIQGARERLVEGGWTVRRLVESRPELLDEPDRWRSLAALEDAVVSLLADWGRADDCTDQRARAAEAPAPRGCRRLVLAGVADPQPLLLLALDRWREELDIDLLVHAPASEAAAFDEWGRPLDTWLERTIAFPHADRRLVMSARPDAEARRAAEILQAHPAGPDQVALGVLDAEVTPFLLREVKAAGHTAYDPAGEPLAVQPLVVLLGRVRGLVSRGACEDLDALLRHPYVLEAACRDMDETPQALLQSWDRVKQEWLPQSLSDLRESLENGRPPGGGRRDANRIRDLVALLAPRLEALDGEDGPGALREFLVWIVGPRMLHPWDEQDECFRSSADRVMEELAALEGLGAAAPSAAADWMAYLLESLTDGVIYPDRDEAELEVEGWLELPWNPAPDLVLAGLNDAYLPGGRLSDPLLPDSLCRRLGIRHDEARWTRDAYLLHSLLAVRRERGRVIGLLARRSMGHDPLKPSRLLFQCEPGDLTERAAHLLAEPPPERLPPEPAFAVQGMPDVLTPVRPEVLAGESLPVTRLRDYLDCPFRFYLKHVLKLEPFEEDKQELDALEFGTLLHNALKGLEAGGGDVGDAAACGHELAEVLESLVRRRFGRRPPLSVQFQTASACQRLHRLAEVQAGLAAEGWRIQEVEQDASLTLRDCRLSGRIDRIDVLPGPNRYRILDYKTGTRATSPRDAHVAALREGDAEYRACPVSRGRKPSAWIDLQLPLYVEMARAEGLVPPDAEVEVGYFQVPAATADIRIDRWPDAAVEEVRRSARECAAGVIADIRRGVFWPPSERSRDTSYDELIGPAGAPRVAPPRSVSGEGAAS